jgi:hypothetical protein
MHFYEAGLIINVTYEKLLEKQLWEKWLAELQLSPYTDQILPNFEDYKKRIFRLAKLQNRTKEEKEKDMNKSFEIAKRAMEKLDPLNDMHLIGKVKKVDLRKKVSLKKKVKTSV